MSHVALIHAWCHVLAEQEDAIWYEDTDGTGIAEVFVPEEGWVSYPCDSAEEFATIIGWWR